jgi:hypothetical protein
VVPTLCEVFLPHEKQKRLILFLLAKENLLTSYWLQLTCVPEYRVYQSGFVSGPPRFAAVRLNVNVSWSSTLEIKKYILGVLCDKTSLVKNYLINLQYFNMKTTHHRIKKQFHYHNPECLLKARGFSFNYLLS